MSNETFNAGKSYAAANEPGADRDTLRVLLHAAEAQKPFGEWERGMTEGYKERLAAGSGASKLYRNYDPGTLDFLIYVYGPSNSVDALEKWQARDWHTAALFAATVRKQGERATIRNRAGHIIG